MKTKVLIIGYGSIGKRHVRILKELGLKVSIVSRSAKEIENCYPSIQEAFAIECPDYIVIANETSKHKVVLQQLRTLNYKGKILVEKPLFNKSNEEQFNFQQIYVGYNLRFHPVIKALKEELRNSDVLTVQAYVGQYLPNWRPGTDYRKSYSATPSKGGGVLRDLSHELDYLTYLFGSWVRLTALGGQYSELEINTEDAFALLYKTSNCDLVSVQLNYLDHIAQRSIIVTTDRTTFKADLINNTLQKNEEIFTFNLVRDNTYIEQHKAILNNETDDLCDYKAGLKVVQMIENAEIASEKGVWINSEQ